MAELESATADKHVYLRCTTGLLEIKAGPAVCWQHWQKRSEVTEGSSLMATVWFSVFIVFPAIPGLLEYGLPCGQVK